MSEDLDLTTTLPDALRTMAESDPPPAMDVARVLHEGRHSVVRRRMAALGGGTAVVVAATAVAVGVLAPAGSAGHGGAGVGAGVGPGTSAAKTPAAGTTTPPPAVNPRDPVTIGWRFGYLPSGMAADGGGEGGMAGATGKDLSTVSAYDSSGFMLSVRPGQLAVVASGEDGVPSEKVPAIVTGARQAYWAGYGNGQIVDNAGPFDGSAGLAWQLPSGEWLSMTVMGLHSRSDWQVQTLRTAAQVVRQDHSLPLPFQFKSSLPQGLTFLGGSVNYLHGHLLTETQLQAGSDARSEPVVMIVAFKTGSQTIADAVPPQNMNTCKDSNGLTVCVSSPTPEPTPLKDAGGAKALLSQITSLGDDPANWTTDVLP